MVLICLIKGHFCRQRPERNLWTTCDHLHWPRVRPRASTNVKRIGALWGPDQYTDFASHARRCLLGTATIGLFLPFFLCTFCGVNTKARVEKKKLQECRIRCWWSTRVRLHRNQTKAGAAKREVGLPCCNWAAQGPVSPAHSWPNSAALVRSCQEIVSYAKLS